MSLLHSGKIKPLFINITVIKELLQFYLQIWEPSSENKGLKQAQDRSVEMTVNKPPSWVKHMLKKICLVTKHQRSMPDDLFRMQITPPSTFFCFCSNFRAITRLETLATPASSSFNTSFRRSRSH